MILGLGDSSATNAPASAGTGASVGTPTSTPAVTLPGFADGLSLWTSPSNAVAAISGIAAAPGAAFSGAVAPFTLGVLAVPLALVAAVLAMSSQR